MKLKQVLEGRNADGKVYLCDVKRFVEESDLDELQEELTKLANEIS